MKLEVFCQTLAEVVGAKVIAHTFGNYAALLDAVDEGSVHMAWLPPLLAAKSLSAGRTVPLLVPIRGDEAWYSTALFSAGDSAIRRVADLRAVRAAWVDPRSMGGYVVIRAWLRAHKIDLRAAFSEESFLGTHEGVVEAVIAGQADVGATFARLETGSETVRTAGWGDARVNVIAVAGPIPSDVLAANVDVPSSTLKAVTEALTGDLQEELRGAALALFEADRFLIAEPERMKALADLVPHLDS
jgi:phosphonate transport system substrate-binding protein